MDLDDVARAVRDAVSFSRAEMERAGVQVAVQIVNDLPLGAFDEAQVRQALLNLLRNAREAMATGGVIDVRVRAEGMSIEVRVEDRGVGIPDEIRERVFDPFFSTKGEGTGLGLAISKHIAEAHGGTLRCEAREGGGTTFVLTLPIAPPRSVRPTAVRGSIDVHGSANKGPRLA
jgi:signal transduction histidine kinase